MRVERPRRSAKATIEQFADELLKRSSDKEVETKLNVIETIALRMSWTKLYNKLHYRQRQRPWWVDT